MSTLSKVRSTTSNIHPLGICGFILVFHLFELCRVLALITLYFTHVNLTCVFSTCVSRDKLHYLGLMTNSTSAVTCYLRFTVKTTCVCKVR